MTLPRPPPVSVSEPRSLLSQGEVTEPPASPTTASRTSVRVAVVASGVAARCSAVAAARDGEAVPPYAGEELMSDAGADPTRIAHRDHVRPASRPSGRRGQPVVELGDQPVLAPAAEEGVDPAPGGSPRASLAARSRPRSSSGSRPTAAGGSSLRAVHPAPGTRPAPAATGGRPPAPRPSCPTATGAAGPDGWPRCRTCARDNHTPWRAS